MSLAEIAQDAANAVGQIQAWANELAGKHVPAVKAEADKAAANPVIQALAAAALSPEDEALIASLIGKLAAAVAAQAATAPPDAPDADAAPDSPDTSDTAADAPPDPVDGDQPAADPQLQTGVAV